MDINDLENVKITKVYDKSIKGHRFNITGLSIQQFAIFRTSLFMVKATTQAEGGLSLAPFNPTEDEKAFARALYPQVALAIADHKKSVKEVKSV